MIRLFMEGGNFWMSLLTVELIAVFLAAWKTPGWVKELGLIALVTGPLGTLIGIYQIAGIANTAGSISPVLIWGGLRVALITTVYGLFIYAVSLVIRIIQKPRLL